jgi:predicted RecB family nuclease
VHRQGREYRYAPGDLIEFFGSPFASWMSRLSCDDSGQGQPDPEPTLLASLAARGQEHEQRVTIQFREAGQTVCAIPSTGERLLLTARAMQSGQAVIYQGTLTDGTFLGIPDFLVRVEGASTLGNYHYEVWDAKLTRSAQPEFLLQLCCYADLLETIQGVRPRYVSLVLGDRTRSSFRTDDYFYYYRRLKAAFLTWMDEFDPQQPPLPETGGNYGQWSTVAHARLAEVDHLSRVANITSGQIRKLTAAGIHTLTVLATTTHSHIPKLDNAVFLRLQEQARLQLMSPQTGPPQYRLHTPTPPEARRGLALLPPASPFDVYFDLEGYPLIEGGLEYLFGATTVERGLPQFHDWWAHDQDEEQRAFEHFMDWVFARWQANPTLHIYHYATYEVTAVRKLMGRYGTREEMVDTLLRNEVFVDLYAIIRNGLRVGTADYSLKSLEHLYRPPRAGDVTTAGESMKFYDQWLASGEPRRWQDSPTLQAIREYNRDDCESTWQLAEWLRARQQEVGIGWVPPRARAEEPAPNDGRAKEPSPQQQLAATLLEQIPPSAAGTQEDTERWRVQALLAHVIEFHRREDKPMWWAMFDRQTMTEEELVEDLSCLGGLRRLSRPPVRIKQSMGFWYAFDAEQETKLDAGSACFFAHDLDMRTEIHFVDRERGQVCLKFGPKKMQQFPHGAPPDRLSLIPDEHVAATVIANSILQTATAWLEHQHLPPALEDFLRRRRPRIRQHQGGPIVPHDGDVQKEVCRVLSALERTTLCIQGPPGTGKTTVAAHAILALLAQGKRIGVVANSHAAILNVLSKCHEIDGALSCLKIGGPADAALFSTYPGAEYAENLRVARSRLSQVALIGGSAWVFSDPTLRESLDYLVVDEAGQVSVANLIGMAPAARNLVLIGDQMQLGQPIQGGHPGESGQSILDYLLQGQATIPEEMGVFLGTTWRLHPLLCSFLSAAVYEGRLAAAPQTRNRVVHVPSTARRVTQEAGILFIPVAHEGNTQGSDEEVAVILELVKELVGRSVTDGKGQAAGCLQLEDLLFVAPYNLQVRKLSAALGPQARVGSVDRFQGQEARVVLVSMCSSEGGGSPRGIEFLLNTNRLNVALSRAQSLAIVVGNPRLAETRCSSVAQMTLLNLFCRIMEEGQSVP